MRILLISDRGANPGGTERYLAELAALLHADGDDVRLLAGVPAGAGPIPPPGTIGAMDPPDVSVADPASAALRALTQVVNPAALSAVRRELLEFRPDAVHLAMLLGHVSPAVLTILGKTPATLVAADLRFVCPKGTKLLPGGEQCRRPAGRACIESGCVSPARAARDGIRQALFRHGQARIGRTYGCSAHVTAELRSIGIAAEHLSLPVNAPPPDFERRPSPSPSFVYAGRLAPVKGIDDLLGAFASVAADHPQAELLICGDGPDREAVASAVATLGLGERVRMRADMALDWVKTLHTATALVAPSRFREPLGLSVIESILHGVPVIATRDGGHSESVEEGVSGVLVPNGDEHGLARAMCEMCSPRPPIPAVVPSGARERLAARHDPAAHVATLRAVWTGPRPSTR